MTQDAILDGYARAAEILFTADQALDSAEIFAPVAHHLPRDQTYILDIGSGTGRDAAWFATQGHEVLAVEPVTRLREGARALHGSDRIAWIDDCLPDVAALRAREERFELIILGGVWQHLAPGERAEALHHLSALTAPGGKVILSLRHGPGAPGRPVYPIDVDQTVSAAGDAGFTVLERVAAPSIQPGNIANGVTWTWLVLSG